MILPNSNIEKYRYNQLPRSNKNNKMTTHKGISSHMLTGKYFSPFSLNHNKSLLLSSSYHKHIRNMNVEVFFQGYNEVEPPKSIGFLDNKMHILKKKNIPTIQL